MVKAQLHSKSSSEEKNNLAGKTKKTPGARTTGGNSIDTEGYQYTQAIDTFRYPSFAANHRESVGPKFSKKQAARDKWQHSHTKACRHNGRRNRGFCR